MTSTATTIREANGRRTRIGLGVVLLAAFMGQIDMFVVNVAAPAIQGGLGASFGQLQFVVNGYVIAYAAGMITGGRLGDRFGRRRVFCWGVTGFAVGSLLCALAPGANLLIAARVVQGLGAAVMMPQVLSVIRAVFPDGRARARAVGAYGATIGSGVVAGLVGGGLLVGLDIGGLGWRTVFLVNLPICLVVLAVTPVTVPESRSSVPPPADPRGALLSGLALPAVLAPLTLGTETGWPAWTWPVLAAGALLVAGFLSHERIRGARGPDPVVPPRLLRNRGFGTSMLTVVAFFAGNAGLFLVLTYHLQADLRLGPLAAGLVFTPLGAGFAIASVAGRRLADRYGTRTATVGAAVMTASLLCVPALTHTAPGTQAWVLAAIMGVGGTGQGLVVARLLTTVLSLVHADDAGTASGLVNTVTQASMAIGTSLIGALYIAVLGTNPLRPAVVLRPADFATAFDIVAAALAVLAVATGVLLEHIRRIDRPAANPAQ